MTRRYQHLMATLLVIVGLSGCDSPTDTDLFVGDALQARLSSELVFLTMRTTPANHMEALFEGGVVQDAAGCLRLDSPDPATVVWPAGWGFERRDGTVRILNGSGQLVAVTGEQMRLGGGEVESLPAVMGFTQADRDLAASHCPGRYWIVSNTD